MVLECFVFKATKSQSFSLHVFFLVENALSLDLSISDENRSNVIWIKAYLQAYGWELLSYQAGHREVGRFTREVNLGEYVTCTPQLRTNKSTQAGFETQRSQKQEYQWPYKKDLCPSIFFEKTITLCVSFQDEVCRIHGCLFVQSKSGFQRRTLQVGKINADFLDEEQIVFQLIIQ